MWHWFLHAVGADNLSGWQYGLWSGFLGSFAVPNITSAGIFWVLFRRHNCHESKCWRIGRVEGDGKLHCHKHHAEKASSE